MLEIKNTLLLMIDVQVKLFAAMYEQEALCRNLQILLKGAGMLDLPMIATEQYPSGLGSTIPEIAALFSEFRPETRPLEKLSFSCCADKDCMEAITRAERKQILLAGIETHVCVYQTAMDLLEAGYSVQIITDAVSSRTARNRDIGLQKMQAAGAGLTSIEIVLFELLRTAESPKFRDLSRLIK